LRSSRGDNGEEPSSHEQAELEKHIVVAEYIASAERVVAAARSSGLRGQAQSFDPVCGEE
jgi:hypothetical protein